MKSIKKNLNIFCFRRDLRLLDNAGFYQALKVAQAQTGQGLKTEVLPLFVFDSEILSRLPRNDDSRVTFIFDQISSLKKALYELGSGLELLFGPAVPQIEKLVQTLSLHYERIHFYCNFDDESYPKRRDLKIQKLIRNRGGDFFSFKDHLIFARDEILSKQNRVYTIYTPYKKAWLEKVKDSFYLRPYPAEKYFHFLVRSSDYAFNASSPAHLEDIGFQRRSLGPCLQTHFTTSMLLNYAEQRNFPGLTGATSNLGIHLRFGTVSPRRLVQEALQLSEVWVGELIWRDFFAQILSHFPDVVKKSFREEFEAVHWRKNDEELSLWKQGLTGYPLVDAGMRELLQTGSMHNRVRMVTASFLAKHLLHHWYEGERWFSGLLLDYDLASNNGNWQWAAGTGCDAAPYFRIFNPTTQLQKFDAHYDYVKKWVPEFQSSGYPQPMVEHAFARTRALTAFKQGLDKGRKNESF